MITVLLANYHGTSVAVKRVLPPETSLNAKKEQKDSKQNPEQADTKQSHVSYRLSCDSWGGLGNQLSAVFKSVSHSMRFTKPCAKQSLHTSKQSAAAEWEKRKKDFFKEMRILANLRHPRITTVMGAVIEKNEEPMLVMEYCEHGKLHVRS